MNTSFKALKANNELLGFSKLSVLIPFKNEIEHLHSLILALEQQTLEKENYEVLLIDDNSSDKGSDFIKKRISELKLDNFKVLKSPSKGKKGALKFGIETSSFDIIVTTDADSIPDQNWLNSISRLYVNDKVKMHIGPVFQQNIEGFWSKVFAIDFLSLIGTTASFALMRNPILCNGANLSFRKESFFEVNGYEDNLHISSGDDMFLLHKLKSKYPRSIAYEPQAIVHTQGPDNWQEFYKQRIRWIGKSKFFKDLTTVIISVAIFFVYLAQLMSFLLGFWKPEYFAVFFCFFLIKFGLDLSFFSRVMNYFNLRLNKVLVFATATFQSIYTPVLIILSLLKLEKE
ncbi:MAG: glycosyltransferase [Flavobacteriales bacterium]|nr:glycosyltransferase [Flavobacteriales bacterium]